MSIEIYKRSSSSGTSLNELTDEELNNLTSLELYEILKSEEASFYGKSFNIEDLMSIVYIENINNILINNLNNNDFLVFDSNELSWINKSPSDSILSLGVTALASELNYNDLTLLGTAETSKVLTSDENGLTILPDTFKLSVGTSEDLQIHHDGTNSLIDNQTGQLRIAAEVASSTEILIGNASSTVLVGQDLTASGVIIGHKDNATSLRVKGAAHANDAGNADPDGDVQSYAGIFTNDAYNQASHAGTKNTRFITGGNLGMDVVTQSAHGLHLIAGDGTQTDGEILMASKNGLTINTRVNPYAVTAPKRLLIDRVDKNTLDSNNTSDVEISVNAGNLVISSNTEIASVDLTGQSVDLNINSNKITNLANPTSGTDAANKAYVDEVAQGIISKPSVLAATTQNLSGTYDNGTLGVGGTLNLGASATLDIDGVTTWSQYDGILVKDQTNAEENGRYYVSQVGNASTDWILTRCGYCDEADEIPGAYIFVASGTANEGTGWVQVVSDPSTFVVGTDPISVYQFSSAGSAGAGAGLTQNGNVLDVNVDNSSIEIDVNDNLKIKASGVTSAMLAGSIANSKLNQLTTANKVALSSMDIDGASELSQGITDSDLLIVDNGGTGVNSSLLASRIPEYTFGKVTGDASITSAGSLSLTSTAITGQTAKTAINDNDIILIADSEDSSNLKKMTRANFVSGLAASSFSSNLVPDSANTYSLGSSSAEWSDLYLGDSAYIYFGNNQDVILRHDLLDGLILQDSAGGSTRPHLTLRSSNSDSNSTGTLRFDNFSTTPAANDKILSIIAVGRDNAGVGHNYARIGSEIVSPVNGSEAGRLTFGVTQAGTSFDNTSSIGLIVEGSSSGGVNVEMPTHDGSSQGLVLGTTLVTATADEINKLDVHTSAPSDGQVLTYTTANGLQWTAASGSSVDLTSIASNVLPDGSNTRSLGSADFEWSDLYLGDSSRIYLGNDQDVYLEHDPDDGIQLHMSSENAQEPAFSIVHNSSSTNFQGPSLQLHNTSLDASTDIIGSVRFIAAGHHSSTISASGKGGGLDTGSDMAFYVCASGQNSSIGLEITGKNNTDGLKVRIPDHNGSTTGLVLGNTLVTASGLEINKLDGLTATTAELNLLDGGTTAQATTLQNTDRVIVNDSGLMKQVALSDVKTYIGSGTFEATAIELGDMLLNYSGSLNSQYLRLTMAANSSDGEPVFLIENDTTSSTGGKLSFSVKEANSNLVGDGDTLGTIEWRETESNGATAFWCHQVGKVLDHTNNYGSLELMVRSGSTSPVTALSIEGSAGGTLVDIEDHDGTDSGLKLGGTLVTSTAAELNALDISAQSPSDNDVLTYTTANGLHWATASGGSGISSVEEDSSPVLGGDLNVRNTADSTNYKITASAGDLVLGVNANNQEFVITANNSDRGSELEAFRIINGQYSNSNVVNGNQIQAIGNMSLNPISGASSSVTSLRLKGEDEASIVLGTTDGVKISRDANDVNRPNTVQISNASESTDDNSPDLEIYSNSTTNSNSSRIRFTRSNTNATSLGELSSFVLNTEYNRVSFDRNNTDGIIKLGVLSSSVIREGIKVQGNSGVAQVRISDAFNLPTSDGTTGQVLSTNGSGQTSWTSVSGGASAPTVITDSSGTNTTISTTSGIEEIHLISNGSNAVTITLPAAATAGSGYKYNIKQLGTANVTIDANGSETIDGSLTFVISSQYSSVTLVTDGSNWFVI